jgi:hypothetical protein
VALGAVMSLDGYIGMDDDTPDPLFDWYFNGDVEVQLRHRRWAHALSAMLSSENAGHGRANRQSYGCVRAAVRLHRRPVRLGRRLLPAPA